MNSIVEVGYNWFGTFVEAFTALTCDIADLIVSSLGISRNANSSDNPDSNPVGSVVSSQTTPTEASSSSSDKLFFNFTQVIQEITSYFVFDDFQYMLLKIFIAILIGNCCLIYIAWHIYGERISENFLSDTPSIPPEELKRRILELNLPRVHSQRY